MYFEGDFNDFKMSENEQYCRVFNRNEYSSSMSDYGAAMPLLRRLIGRALEFLM